MYASNNATGFVLRRRLIAVYEGLFTGKALSVVHESWCTLQGFLVAYWGKILDVDR